MKLIFRIDYRTNWGESLYVSANIPALGGGEHAKALKMEIDGDRAWHAEQTVLLKSVHQVYLPS